MKYLAILLLTFGLFGSAQAIDECMVGAWNDPERIGEGIAFEVNPGTGEINGFFYTYDGNVPHWYVLLGDEKDITMYTGQKLEEEPFTAFVAPHGIAQILEVNSDTLVFTYDLALKTNGNKCNPGNDDICSGEFIYKRITQMIPCGD